MRYTRVYTDEHGESHFEDVEVPTTLEPSSFSAGAWLISELYPVTGILFRRVTQEHGNEPHTAPRQQFIVHLAGEAEIETSDGERRRFGPGSVLLVEDTTGKGHTTRRVGDTIRDTLFLPLAE
ncbi:MAG: hypothetical protein M3P40_03255 [Actinomycetota bacterium]|nr:hypothetical protein [Actinomycetota bacterium]